MQVAVSEFARHVAGMEGANSTEMDLETPFPVIDLLPEQKEIADMGGTMRLGADPVKLHDSTPCAASSTTSPSSTSATATATRSTTICAGASRPSGLICSGTSPDERLVEVIELARDDHPFFVASQYHPEFKSRPERPAPLFREFVGAALAHARSQRREPAEHGDQRRRRRRSPPRFVRRATDARARAAARHVRGAVPDRESVGPRARLRATGSARSSEPIGLDVEEDRAGPAAGRTRATCWPGFPAPSERAILLCAHMDTVPPLAPIEPVIVDGGWENANEGILGADNKAAVAVLLELARRLASAARAAARSGSSCCSRYPRRTDCTARKAFDAGRLRSRFGYVLDHASPIGEIVIASPTHHRIAADVHGPCRPRRHPSRGGPQRDRRRRPGDRRDASSAGSTLRRRPTLARSRGGTATNVVPERCEIEAEVRVDRRGPRRGRS